MVMPPWLITIGSWLSWFLEKGLALFTTAWTTSKKTTEIAIALGVVFLALVYFGFVKKPNVTPELSAQIEQLSLKIDKLQTEIVTRSDLSLIEDQIAGSKTPQTTGSIVRRSKKKVAE